MREKQFVARHRQIFEELRRKITLGEYPNGAKLPTGQELCKIYSVSRITIAAVFEHLREAGLIRSVRHAGSFSATSRKMIISAPFCRTGKRPRSSIRF